MNMIGKVVDVFFSKAPSLHNVRVIYEPQQPGDNWVFVSGDGAEHRAMVFERISEVR
jgi:hypothetical protein